MKRRNIKIEKICGAALLLIEKEGLEGLSMRKLAAQLNIEAASLYNHIANKAELLDMIQEHLYSQIPGSFSVKNWKNHLEELAMATRRGLLQIPKVVTLFATRPTITHSSLKQVEITLGVLIKAGFKLSEVMAIYRNIHVFVLGHVLAEVGYTPGENNHQHEPSLEKINIDNYPILKKSYSYKSNSDFEKGFKIGINTIINGLEILLNKRN